MDMPCRIEMLGGLRLHQADRLITRFRTRKAGVLLAYLAYHLRQTHPREVLIDLLWPELEPEAGRDNLSTILSSLRHQLEPPGVPVGAVLIADRFALRLNPAAVTTDVSEFEARLRAAEQVNSERERGQQLADALATYTGPLLPGYYEDWIETERNRLAEVYLQTARRLVRALVKGGELQRALDYARQAVAADILREEAHRDLMQLYVATGQPSAALEQYRELEQILAKELGESPSAATRRLVAEIQARVRTAASSPPSPTREASPPESVRPAAIASHPTVTPAVSSEVLPGGTFTLLLTEVAEAPTLKQRVGERARHILESHRALLRSRFAQHHGQEIRQTEEGFTVAFSSAGEALACAVACRQALEEQVWPPEIGCLRVRMALHTGDSARGQEEKPDSIAAHATRLLTAAHGGQILCSETTAALLRRSLEPGIHLKDLGLYRLWETAEPERIFQVAYAEMPEPDFLPLNAPAGYRLSLPMQFTRFFGREEELMRLEKRLLLPETRLITLTGPGGSGKTRLALEAARRLAHAFSGAVWFAPLADISEARLIPGALAEALRLPRTQRSEPLEPIIETLSRHPALLVLDNFEQLVDAGAGWVRTLLERVPSLKCLITSRQRLELAGEQELPVSPLPTPQTEGALEQLSLFESVQLFVDRAQGVKPDFQVTESNAGAVATLCRNLEGLPLALELAAARAQVLTPAQMLIQMENRFDFLVSRRRDAAERHRTLRAAIDWSYHLLTPPLQRFFTELAVFRGGWSLEAAEAVCAAPLALDYLSQLRECSLIVTEEEGPQIRFRMLEMLREYAWQRLLAGGEANAVRTRHRDYFLALAEQAAAQQASAERGVWLLRLEAEHENLRAALAWCRDEGAGIEAGLRLATALASFWQTHGHAPEGRAWFADMLTRAGDLGDTETRAAALSKAGFLAFYQGDYAEARARFEEALAIRQRLGNRQRHIQAMNDLGLALSYQGDYAAAHQVYQESVALSREGGDPQVLAVSLGNYATLARRCGDYALARSLHAESLALRRQFGTKQQIAMALNNLGMVAGDQEDYALALACLEESLTLRRELGDPWRIAIALNSLGGLAHAQGDYASATARYAEGLALCRELGDKNSIAITLTLLAGVAAAQQDYRQAHALLAESLTLRQEVGNRPGIAGSLEALASLASAQEQHPRAARLLGAAEALHAAISSASEPEDQAEWDRTRTAAHTALGETEFAAIWIVGKAMSLPEAVVYALEEGL